MTPAIEEKNKAFVLEPFETLFNKRDYATAERFWFPNYIQHSAHIPPGREGLFALIKGAPEACLTAAAKRARNHNKCSVCDLRTMTNAKTLLLDLLAVIPDGEKAAAFLAEDGVFEIPFLHAIGIPTRY